jgi:serine/threonine protein kinase
MALAAGTRLGAYEITASLGAGGMGEVYRAIDTTLEREVAIKVLPESLASDADRLARLEREAKTLASLNHPNIAQIYGLERSEGKTALVMELVEGSTLA